MTVVAGEQGALAAPAQGWRAAALAGFAAVVLLGWLVEPDWVGLGLALAAFGLLWSLVYALVGRPATALAAALVVFGTIWAASVLKFSIVAMNLHVYDVFLYLPSLAQIRFFFATFPSEAALLLAGSLAAAAGLGIIWRREPAEATSRRRRFALVAFTAAATLLAALPFRGNNVDFFAERRSIVSSFLASLADVPQLLRFDGVIEVAAAAVEPTLPAGVIDCSPAGETPDIVLFLNESAMPPGVYPEIAYPDELAPFFASQDGVTRRLRVETFGGGTWLTDFSALTGLSTRSFGSLQNFAAQLMSGRLRHSLPQYLKACGYETTMIYPALADFAGVRRLYQSIGFDRIVDAAVHQAPDGHQRDAFYLGLVEKVLEEAAASSRRRPQFVVASSMGPHGPWNFRFAPEAIRPGERLRWNAQAETDEYLWRLLLAARDRDAMRARLRERLPTRKILYVDYGDHQPALAALPLRAAPDIAAAGRSWQLDPASRGFETYYAIAAQGFAPRFPGSEIPILEAANLPIVTVIAAGLPLDPVFARRRQLMEHCRGLYGTCADRAAVLAFQRWLTDAGWIARK